jgi:hypothetical protein
LLKCLNQKWRLLTSVFSFDGFTLLATLLDNLVFGKLWSRLSLDVVR